MLVIRSTEADKVLYYHAQEIYKKAGEPKYLLTVSNGHLTGPALEKIAQKLSDRIAMPGLSPKNWLFLLPEQFFTKNLFNIFQYNSAA